MSTLTETKPQTEAPKTRTMNAADRCDSCGAQAYASATFITGELLFCGHHFTRHEAKIAETSVSVLDERSFLVSKVSSAGEGFV